MKQHYISSAFVQRQLWSLLATDNKWHYAVRKLEVRLQVMFLSTFPRRKFQYIEINKWLCHLQEALLTRSSSPEVDEEAWKRCQYETNNRHPIDLLCINTAGRTQPVQCVDVKYECAFYISKVKLPFSFERENVVEENWITHEATYRRRQELCLESNSSIVSILLWTPE